MSLRQIFKLRKDLPPGLEKEFIEYKDIKSIDRIQVGAWIGFILSLFLLPLDYSRIKSGEYYLNDYYRYLFYFHLFGLFFLIPAWSMTWHKGWVITTKLRRGIHIWGMVVMAYLYLFGMGIVVFLDRDGLIIYMAFIFICNWMFAMSHTERIAFILTTLPPMFLIIMLKPADQVSYSKAAMFYEITFLTIVASVFDAFDYNLKLSNFLALKKNQQEEYGNRVEAMMLQKFTSIHPAIQWRFREEAIQLLNDTGTHKDPQNIMFENVYPFYGSLDIRNSSKNRRRAIAQDLLFNLEIASKILHRSSEEHSFHAHDELLIKIEKNKLKINTDFSSRDEEGIASFIRNEISPLIVHLRQQYPHLEDITRYYQAVCAATGVFTLYRSGYEEALRLINQCLLSCLDEEERDLLRKYPCYVEKHQTDGVEYNIYAGASIANVHHSEPLNLDDLRLHQLLWTCKIMRRVNELQPQIMQLLHPVEAGPMRRDGQQKDVKQIEIAPLILSYMTPVTLKFRSDEKRLDVDGSYNYEVLKKRIDKAVISGTSTRLTQPGTISIVYTLDQEASAYEKHLHYLLEENLILPGWEHLQLESMPGAEGIMALRVQVIS